MPDSNDYDGRNACAVPGCPEPGPYELCIGHEPILRLCRAHAEETQVKVIAPGLIPELPSISWSEE